MNAARTGRFHDYHKPHLFKDTEGEWHVVGGAGWEQHARAYEAAEQLNARRAIRRLYFRPDDFYVWGAVVPSELEAYVRFPVGPPMTYVDHPQLGFMFVRNTDLEEA
jgi:hypothetical protein